MKKGSTAIVEVLLVIVAATVAVFGFRILIFPAQNTRDWISSFEDLGVHSLGALMFAAAIGCIWAVLRRM